MEYDKKIEFIRKNKSFPISIFWYYFRAIGLFVFSIFCIITSLSLIYEAITTDMLKVKARYFLLIFVVIIAYYGLAILFGLKNELKSIRFFKEIVTGKTKLENLKMASDILNKNFKNKGVSVDGLNDVVITQTNSNLLTWGEEITIICDESRILVNSKSIRNQAFSYGKNSKNIQKISNEIIKHGYFI
jgi:hypothetical protein